MLERSSLHYVRISVSQISKLMHFVLVFKTYLGKVSWEPQLFLVLSKPLPMVRFSGWNIRSFSRWCRRPWASFPSTSESSFHLLEGCGNLMSKCALCLFSLFYDNELKLVSMEKMRNAEASLVNARLKSESWWAAVFHGEWTRTLGEYYTPRADALVYIHWIFASKVTQSLFSALNVHEHNLKKTIFMSSYASVIHIDWKWF